MSTGADRTACAAGAYHTACAAALERELEWLDAVLRARLADRFGDRPGQAVIAAPPDLAGDPSALAALVADCALDAGERLVLAVALVPHLRPQLLDLLFVRDLAIDRPFTEFGGRKAQAHSGFLPTGETAAFLLAGNDLAARAAIRAMFAPDHAFHRAGILRLDHDTGAEPVFSGMLVLSGDTLAWLCTGVRNKPDFSGDFPAHLITTALVWDDLVLSREVSAEIAIIRGWIEHGAAIMAEPDFGRILKPGYRSLFYGPPGTGKTLTAMLIGQSVGKDVYRIDLSMVVSKFIGETEKNLARVFDRAETGDWILFFDEADALFGKRTATGSSNDRYANQEVSYLLQRVEDFAGHVILATNLKGNIDEAFARRFQSMVHFPMPDVAQRLALWRGVFRNPERLAPEVNLPELAERYVLSGGAIANVVRFAAVSACCAGRRQIDADDLHLGVVKELRKEGRTL